MIYILLITLGFIILYQAIKFKCTEYRYTEVFTLKNEIPPNVLGGKPYRFNLIGNIPGMSGDKVYIKKKDKYVFNKLVKTTFEVCQSNYHDDDDSFM